jgi:hypothetical protein
MKNDNHEEPTIAQRMEKKLHKSMEPESLQSIINLLEKEIKDVKNNKKRKNEYKELIVVTSRAYYLQKSYGAAKLTFQHLFASHNHFPHIQFKLSEELLLWYVIYCCFVGTDEALLEARNHYLSVEYLYCRLPNILHRVNDIDG